MHLLLLYLTNQVQNATQVVAAVSHIQYKGWRAWTFSLSRQQHRWNLQFWICCPMFFSSHFDYGLLSCFFYFIWLHDSEPRQ